MALTRFLNFRVVLLRPGTREVAGATERATDGDLSVLMVEEPAEEGKAGSAFCLFAHATTSYYAQLLRYAGYDDAAEVPADARSVTWSTVLPPEEAATLARLLPAALNTPAVPEPPPGCDGTWYTLSLESAEGTRGFRWWVSPPTGWEPAASVVSLLERAAVESLATVTPTFADAPPRPKEGTAGTSGRPWWRRLLGA